MKTFSIGRKRYGIKQEAIVPFFMLIFSTAYVAETYTLSSKSLAFPKMLLAVLILSSAFTLKKSIVPVEKGSGDEPVLLTRNSLLFFFILFAFALAIPYIGVYMAIPLFLVGTMLMLGVRSVKTLIIVPIMLVVGIHLVFSVLLETSLPTGSLFNLF